MPHSDPVEGQRYNREYKRANRHRYARRQKAWDAARHANAKAERLGVPGRLTTDEVQQILASGRCHYCRAPRAYLEMEIDHVIPFSAQGCTNTVENVVAACEPCNARKAAKASAGAWSRHAPECVECGTTEQKHAAHGRCVRCNNRLTNLTRDRRRTS